MRFAAQFVKSRTMANVFAQLSRSCEIGDEKEVLCLIEKYSCSALTRRKTSEIQHAITVAYKNSNHNIAQVLIDEFFSIGGRDGVLQHPIDLRDKKGRLLHPSTHGTSAYIKKVSLEPLTLKSVAPEVFERILDFLFGEHDFTLLDVKTRTFTAGALWAAWHRRQDQYPVRGDTVCTYKSHIEKQGGLCRRCDSYRYTVIHITASHLSIFARSSGGPPAKVFEIPVCMVKPSPPGCSGEWIAQILPRFF